MARPVAHGVAKVDIPYVERELPLTFFGVKHSRWTKEEMVQIIGTLEGAATTAMSRLDLYAMIHDRYNPQRVLQRTINQLETIAEKAAGRGVRAQAKVHKAVRQATEERAELARERRFAARPPQLANRASVAPSHKAGYPDGHVVAAGRRRTELPRNDWEDEVVADEYDHWHDPFWPINQPRRAQQPPPAPERHLDQRQLDAEALEFFDLLERERIGFGQARALNFERARAKRPQQNLHQVPGGQHGLAPLARVNKKRQAVDAPLERPQKRTRPDVDAAARTPQNKTEKADNGPERRKPSAGPQPIAFGTSTAIRDLRDFRVGLEPIDLAAAGERPACQVCADDLDPLLAFQVSVPSQCNHSSEICLSCWEQHIAAEADSKSWDAITCPHANCRVTLDHSDMQRFAPAEIFRRYDQFQTRQALSRQPGYHLCAHGGCGSGAFVDDAHVAVMTCPDCGEDTCLWCNLARHEGRSCAENRRWLADAPKRADAAEQARRKELERADQESDAYLNRHSKTCPNGQCGARIEKTHGCDHMRCKFSSLPRFSFCLVSK
jgi:IBR domain, a half RING-finger domain